MNTIPPALPKTVIDEQTKRADIKRLRNLLLAGAASPATTPVDDAYFEALRARVRAHKP